MAMSNGEPSTEPFIPVHTDSPELDATTGKYKLTINLSHVNYVKPTNDKGEEESYEVREASRDVFKRVDSVLVDYYTPKQGGARKIEITPEKFGGNYYLEASTLLRDTNGVDMPAEFIIPNCKIQSNFTFTMASTGDPSTFTFTMDAFPDYTRFDKTKKVLAAIQIISATSTEEELKRPRTQTTDIEDPTSGLIVRPAVASE